MIEDELKHILQTLEKKLEVERIKQSGNPQSHNSSSNRISY
jgi:hypothetical protein